ncbi:hypothetical protein FW778_20955 [Ginsengibacter hankyongi]|uniref:Uncharacterized protein n=1 Tax=Ginsengibacter hankyongi TaxID=2607284 RepID=A0A5J5IAS9_9BACT|nr:hypothetical protein [Ginsengibacter hankyongi]KAA9035696.1 hypothetical protein FW778_20955 [Ginsengibacter hankyongi]
MADNTNEEHLDNSANTQSENTSDEVTPATKREITNSNQENANMEVHKHPHNVTHKKEWGEYLLEFIMLFLAVFLGFLAENYREHQVEKERGRQYIESFYEDLQTDTARISFYTNFDEIKIRSLDNLSSCYNTITQNDKEASCLLDIIKNTSINRPFKKTERTLNQLFNAGGFRLLPKEDADSIIMYQKEYDNFQDFQLTVFQDAQNNIRNTFDMLINFNANNQMFKPKEGNLITSFNSDDVTAPILFTDDKALLNKYFNELKLYYRVTYNHKKMLLNLKDNQIRLLHYFENKYHFEKDHN